MFTPSKTDLSFKLNYLRLQHIHSSFIYVPLFAIFYQDVVHGAA